jgi:hypothetical protein
VFSIKITVGFESSIPSASSSSFHLLVFLLILHQATNAIRIMSVKPPKTPPMIPAISVFFEFPAIGVGCDIEVSVGTMMTDPVAINTLVPGPVVLDGLEVITVVDPSESVVFITPLPPDELTTKLIRPTVILQKFPEFDIGARTAIWIVFDHGDATPKEIDPE